MARTGPHRTAGTVRAFAGQGARRPATPQADAGIRLHRRAAADAAGPHGR